MKEGTMVTEKISITMALLHRQEVTAMPVPMIIATQNLRYFMHKFVDMLVRANFNFNYCFLTFLLHGILPNV